MKHVSKYGLRHRWCECVLWIAVALWGGGAAAIEQDTLLIPWDVAAQGGDFRFIGMHVIDGPTAYHVMRDVSTSDGNPIKAQITRIDDFATEPDPRVLVSAAAWETFLLDEGLGGAGTLISAGKGMAVVDGRLRWYDSGLEAVLDADVETGALSVYTTTEQILAHTGADRVMVTGANEVGPTGEVVFYDEESDHVLTTNGPGQVETLISLTELEEAIGPLDPGNNFSTYIRNAGMSFDPAGNLYFASSESDFAAGAGGPGEVYRWDAQTQQITRLLSRDEIVAVTGLDFFSVAFSDVEYAPNGLVYFYDRGSDSILSFDPDDPADTLEIFRSEAELLSLAGNDFVGAFDWHDNALTFHTLSAETGVYALVAPAAAIPGDFDGDGDVDAFDLGIWQTGFGITQGATPADGDADEDGDVDAFDLGLWQTNFGTGAGTAVPEPTSVFLLGLAGATLVSRRRRHRLASARQMA